MYEIYIQTCHTYTMPHICIQFHLMLFTDLKFIYFLNKITTPPFEVIRCRLKTYQNKRKKIFQYTLWMIEYSVVNWNIKLISFRSFRKKKLLACTFDDCNLFTWIGIWCSHCNVTLKGFWFCPCALWHYLYPGNFLTFTFKWKINAGKFLTFVAHLLN